MRFTVYKRKRRTVSPGCKAGPLAKISAGIINNRMAVQAALKLKIAVAVETKLIYCSLLMSGKPFFCFFACKSLSTLCALVSTAMCIEFVASYIFFAEGAVAHSLFAITVQGGPAFHTVVVKFACLNVIFLADNFLH